MKRILASVIFGGALIGCVAFPASAGSARTAIGKSSFIPADSSQVSFKPDHEYRQAILRNDKAAVARILEDEFTWTDSSGLTLSKLQTLEKMPVPALGDENQANEQDWAINRQISIHRAERGNIYIIRVWVKHGTNWRLLAYQEVKTQSAPPQSDPGAQGCDNPCKTVPFEPKNDDEREVIQAYQQVETAVTAHDSAAWGSHIGEEFFAVTSNSDHPLDKKTRMAGLDNQKQGGIAPFPLVSARMFKFGDAMVMESQQQPANGKPLHVTRIWIKRDGKWVEVLSYQTTIESAAN